MCRITGFVDFASGHYSLEGVLASMRDSLSYGGPDDAGSFIDDHRRLALGHRRLSILDTTERGHQPMRFKHLVIVFNGEIYNYREIQTELQGLGYGFDSQSDTEVILKAYDAWGEKALEKFHGMWAFALWDEQREVLLLSRDRFGVKPLYYYVDGNVFCFASELKAFHKHPKFKKQIDFNSLGLYFQFGYIPSDKAIFENVHKLPAGSNLFFEFKTKKLDVRKYYDASAVYNRAILEREDLPIDVLVEELERVLQRSFSLRLVSDVPVGVFLSGGIDSSLVTAVLQRRLSSQKLKTFTIGFDETKFDESNWASKVAQVLGTEHSEVVCTIKDALDIVPSLPEIYDEPFGDSSAIPTVLLSRFSRKLVKVALSADGADELFAGYDSYRLVLNRLLPFKKFRKLLPYAGVFYARNDRYKKLKAALGSQNFDSLFQSSTMHFLPDELPGLFLKEASPSLVQSLPGDLDQLSRMMLIDTIQYLPDDILVKVDRATMSVGLEAREPFLDQDVFSFAAKLSTSYKLAGGEGKVILRKLLSKYLPDEIVYRKKQGFAVPIERWLKQELRNMVRESLSEDRLRRQGIFESKAVLKVLDNFENGQAVRPSKIWLLFMFQLWHEKYA